MNIDVSEVLGKVEQCLEPDRSGTDIGALWPY